jgi:hypothetical protein
MVSIQHAACSTIHICPMEKVPATPTSHAEANTVGAPQAPKRAYVLCSKVGGHTRRILPPADSTSPGIGIQQRTSGSRGPWWRCGSQWRSNTALHEGRWRREGEEGLRRKGDGECAGYVRGTSARPRSPGGPGHPAPGTRSTGPSYVIHLWNPTGRLRNGIKSAIKPETSANHSGHVLLVSSHLYPRPSVGILRVSSLRIPLARCVSSCI